MKKIIIISLILVSMILSITTIVSACDFNYKIYKTLDDLKNDLAISVSNTNFKIGGEIYLVIYLKETHRNCLHELEDVKYEMNNIKVLGATDWEEIEIGYYKRVFKIQFGAEIENTYFKAYRICVKSGGEVLITFDVYKE